MRATGMKSPTENESCSTCGRSEFRFGSPNSMTWPSAALLSTYSAPTTPPPPVRITEIIGWPKWGSAAVVMMLAWSTCEPPNGYGVTNCSSLSGNALAALVSAKAATAVVASEVIDRRVVMISLFATTFLRSPRHRRRLAFGNRQVPSLEVGDVLRLLRCCHAVQRIAWTRTDHRSLRRVVTARARSLPALIYPIDETVVGNIPWTFPANRSLNAGPPPR